MSDKVTTGSGGFSGGISPFDDPFVELCCCCCCLAGSGGGRSSPDDELIVDATLFCDGDEQTPPSPPLDGRLAVDDRLSLTASERSGRLAVNCCVNSITTDGDWASGGGLAFTVSDEDEASSEWALEPDWIETKGAAFNTKRHTHPSQPNEKINLFLHRSIKRAETNESEGIRHSVELRTVGTADEGGIIGWIKGGDGLGPLSLSSVYRSRRCNFSVVPCNYQCSFSKRESIRPDASPPINLLAAKANRANQKRGRRKKSSQSAIDPASSQGGKEKKEFPTDLKYSSLPGWSERTKNSIPIQSRPAISW